MFDQSKKYLFVTPVLPYAADGTIDELQYRSLLRRYLEPQYIAAGMALIANPEAGEIFYLDREEKRRIVEITIEEAAGRVPVFAGVIDTTTTGTVAVAEDAAAAGADGLFVMPPIGALDISSSWNADLYPEVFIDMLHAITDSVDLPMIVHPTSSASARYGIGIPAKATRAIIDAVPQIVGWKMTYNYDGFRELTRTLRSVERPIAILGAVASYFHENLATGAFDGTATGTWNYAHEAMFEHIQAWERGDIETARKIWEGGLAQLHEYVYSDFSRLHIRYKVACWLRGAIDSPAMRAPLPRPLQDEIDTLKQLLARTGLPVIDDSAIEAYTTSHKKALVG